MHGHFKFYYIIFVQPLLEKLQSSIKEENTGHDETTGKAESKTCDKSSKLADNNSQIEEKYTSYDSGDLKEARINFDPEVVQIKAGKAEVSDLDLRNNNSLILNVNNDINIYHHAYYLQIDRRISAFIERKQAEINENNVREFCNVIDCNQGNYPVSV